MSKKILIRIWVILITAVCLVAVSVGGTYAFMRGRSNLGGNSRVQKFNAAYQISDVDKNTDGYVITMTNKVSIPVKVINKALAGDYQESTPLQLTVTVLEDYMGHTKIEFADTTDEEYVDALTIYDNGKKAKTWTTGYADDKMQRIYTIKGQQLQQTSENAAAKEHDDWGTDGRQVLKEYQYIGEWLLKNKLSASEMMTFANHRLDQAPTFSKIADEGYI